MNIFMYTHSHNSTLIMSYRAGIREDRLRGAGAGHLGARRGARAATAPGGAAVRGATAGVRLRLGGRR